MENKVENRVTESLLDWTDKENRLRAVFGNDVIKGRNFLESKRDFFNKLYKSCKTDATSEEKVMLNVIRGETKKLDKMIHPNAATRLIFKMAGRIKESIQSYRQNRSLKEEMLPIWIKQKPLEYNKNENGKNKELKNELRESSKETLDVYKKKGAKLKSKEENKPALKSENGLLPKKSTNPNHGRSIY
ncbi:MAG: hypothetical protein M3R72_09735 [Bacteroidota bacterium]|nr:hypothetical protein [Bacteroidota bacterium]